jgi:glycosyltransferase involved in cell wall biosynthesis
VLRGATIICIASIDWAFNWQLPQEVVSAFAASGNHVLFVENTGVRRPSLKDASRLRARFLNWRHADHGIRTVAEGLDVFSPLLVPLPYSRIAGFINARVFARAVRRWLANNRRGPLIVITFLPTPLARGVIRLLDPALVVYYCADRFAESSPGARRLHHSERALFGEADLVLTTSRSLQAAAVKVSSHAELLTCGVRSAEFAQARQSGDAAPAVFRDLARPVIGFAGSLRNELDLAMLSDVVELAPEMNFVLAGPVSSDLRRLSSRPNVRLVGGLSHQEVMHYLAHFDVGTLPYALNAFTAALMPMKLKEYLAAGLPVVSTPIPEVCHFAEQHPGVVDFAKDAPTFVAALRAAVGANGTEAIAHRMEIARSYDWSEQMSRMSEMMEAALAAKRLR